MLRSQTFELILHQEKRKNDGQTATATRTALAGILREDKFNTIM